MSPTVSYIALARASSYWKLYKLREYKEEEATLLLISSPLSSFTQSGGLVNTTCEEDFIKGLVLFVLEETGKKVAEESQDLRITFLNINRENKNES